MGVNCILRFGAGRVSKLGPAWLLLISTSLIGSFFKVLHICINIFWSTLSDCRAAFLQRFCLQCSSIYAVCLDCHRFLRVFDLIFAAVRAKMV